MLRCAYVDLPLFGNGLGARALEACDRADVEVVPVGGEHGATPAWIEPDGTLVLDGEELAAGGLAAAVERHRRARAYERGDAIGVGTALDLAPAVGAFWLAGERDGLRRAAVLRGLHHQPLVLPPRGQQLVPGLDVADDGHGRSH